MQTLLRNLIHGFRALRRTPSFTIIAIVTIALGIGASTAIFSVVNAVLLRPLPYGDAGRLAVIWSDLRNRDVVDFPIAPADFHDLREQATLFEELAAVFTFRPTLTTEGGEPEQIRAAGVTPNIFRLLGVRVLAGRDFVDADGAPVPPPPDGAAPEDLPPPPPASVVLSHAFWQRRFGGDPSVVGRTLDVGGQRGDVIGVLAPGVELLFPPGTNVEQTPDVWVATRIDYAAGSRINVFLRVIGRLRPDVTIAAAQAQLDGISAELRRQFPIKETAGTQHRIEPMHADLVADVRPAVLTLMGAVLLVLLIACANVANLLLVRAAARERELAVRAALGGSRTRLVAQLMTESTLLAAGGALLGLLIAWGGIRLLGRLRPDGLPRIDHVALDPMVLGFTALASVIAAVLFGLVPAWRASRTDIAGVLRESGRTGALARGRVLRNGVIVAEVALSFVLLIGSGLMLRSFAALQRIDPGLDDAGVLTFVANARGNDDQRLAFMQQMQQRLAAVPGVAAVTAATPLPLDGTLQNARWGTEEAAADPARFQQTNVHAVLPGYFETLRARLLAGRTFTDADNNPNTLYVVIDDVLARKAFGDAPAVGRRLLLRVRTNDPETFEVIGVVAHQRHVGLSGDPKEAVFLTDGLFDHGAASRWALRTDGDPLRIAPAVRAAVRDVDPLVAVAEVQPLRALRDRAAAPTRFALVLIGTFAVIAAFLAAIGLYGVLSTSVRQRTAEIGVRVAFGASRRRVLRLILSQGMLLSAAGIAVGGLAALALTRTAAGILVGVQPNDPATFATTAVVFLAIALAACAVPAWRAARLDPASALRDD
ncbi:MAG TPA: ABC transporter permease [Longimicrobiales bacterium]